MVALSGRWWSNSDGRVSRGVSPALLKRGCAGPGCRGNSCCHCNRLETWEGRTQESEKHAGMWGSHQSGAIDSKSPWSYSSLGWDRVCSLGLGASSVLDEQAQAAAQGSPGPPEGVTASSLRSHPCQVWGQSWLQGLQHLPGSGLMSSISFQSWADVKKGCMPRWVLGGFQHHPCCPSYRGGSRVEICLPRESTSNP